MKNIEASKSKLAAHRVQVYHKSMGYIFGSLKHTDEIGLALTMSECIKVGVPTIAALSMDYEELCVFSDYKVAFYIDPI